MPTQANDPETTILLAEDDVIVRIAIADHLRGCGFRVIEAASGHEAKTVLQHGPEINVLMADVRLAGSENGFALAQWARLHRPNIRVLLSVSLESKVDAALDLCPGAPPQSGPQMRGHINRMRRRLAGTGRAATGSRARPRSAWR